MPNPWSKEEQERIDGIGASAMTVREQEHRESVHDDLDTNTGEAPQESGMGAEAAKQREDEMLADAHKAIPAESPSTVYSEGVDPAEAQRQFNEKLQNGYFSAIANREIPDTGDVDMDAFSVRAMRVVAAENGMELPPDEELMPPKKEEEPVDPAEEGDAISQEEAEQSVEVAKTSVDVIRDSAEQIMDIVKELGDSVEELSDAPTEENLEMAEEMDAGMLPGEDTQADEQRPAVAAAKEGSIADSSTPKAEGEDEEALKDGTKGRADVGGKLVEKKLTDKAGKVEAKSPEGVILFADGARGIYIPQYFAQSIKKDLVKGVSDEDWEILEAGPDHEFYLETWDDVERKAEVVLDGHKYTLTYGEGGGDLFLICPELMTPEEKENFGMESDEPDQTTIEDMAPKAVKAIRAYASMHRRIDDADFGKVCAGLGVTVEAGKKVLAANYYRKKEPMGALYHKIKDFVRNLVKDKEQAKVMWQDDKESIYNEVADFVTEENGATNPNMTWVKRMTDHALRNLGTTASKTTAINVASDDRTVRIMHYLNRNKEAIGIKAPTMDEIREGKMPSMSLGEVKEFLQNHPIAKEGDSEVAHRQQNRLMDAIDSLLQSDPDVFFAYYSMHENDQPSWGIFDGQKWSRRDGKVTMKWHFGPDEDKTTASLRKDYLALTAQKMPHAEAIRVVASLYGVEAAKAERVVKAKAEIMFWIAYGTKNADGKPVGVARFIAERKAATYEISIMPTGETFYLVNRMKVDAFPQTPYTKSLLAVFEACKKDTLDLLKLHPDDPKYNGKYWAVKEKVEGMNAVAKKDDDDKPEGGKKNPFEKPKAPKKDDDDNDRDDTRSIYSKGRRKIKKLLCESELDDDPDVSIVQTRFWDEYPENKVLGADGSLDGYYMVVKDGDSVIAIYNDGAGEKTKKEAKDALSAGRIDHDSSSYEDTDDRDDTGGSTYPSMKKSERDRAIREGRIDADKKRGGERNRPFAHSRVAERRASAGLMDGKQVKWDIYFAGKKKKSMLFPPSFDKAKVVDTLVEKYGYHPDTTVKKAEDQTVRSQRSATAVSKGEIEDMIRRFNEAGSNFRLGETYGQYDLWATDKEGKEHRLESGSANDIKQALIKYRFNEKYQKATAGEHDEVPAETEEFESASKVADTILDQLGGQKFLAMTGAQPIIGGKGKELTLKLPAFAKDGINTVTIGLNSEDLYDVVFSRYTNRPKATYTVVDEVKGVYAEDLQRIFTDHTGLETSLGTMRGQKATAGDDQDKDFISRARSLAEKIGVSKENIEKAIAGDIDAVESIRRKARQWYGNLPESEEQANKGDFDFLLNLTSTLGGEQWAARHDENMRKKMPWMYAASQKVRAENTAALDELREIQNWFSKNPIKDMPTDTYKKMSGEIKKKSDRMRELMAVLYDETPLRQAATATAATGIKEGDLVKVDMAVVKRRDNMPPYIRLVQKTIRDAENGTPYVAYVKNGMAEIRSWRGNILGDVSVPVEACTVVGSASTSLDDYLPKEDVTAAKKPGGIDVRQSKGKWEVVDRNDNDKILGTHDTEEKAREQQKAIYASMNREAKAEKTATAAANPIDIGDGYYAHKIGYDRNGNWAVWVSKGANPALKIQTNGEAPEAHRARGKYRDLSEAVAALSDRARDELKDYHKRFGAKTVAKKEGGESRPPFPVR